MKSNITNKIQLRDLLETTEWQTLCYGKKANNLSKLKSNEIATVFTSAGVKPENEVDRIIIRIGPDVLNDLNWQLGDKVIPMFNEDDQFIFRIVKSENGFIISKDNLGGFGKISFVWKGKCKLQRMNSTVQDHDIYKGQLIFRIGNWADAIV